MVIGGHDHEAEGNGAMDDVSSYRTIIRDLIQVSHSRRLKYVGTLATPRLEDNGLAAPLVLQNLERSRPSSLS
jgi:hypothetical protein